MRTRSTQQNRDDHYIYININIPWLSGTPLLSYFTFTKLNHKPDFWIHVDQDCNFSCFTSSSVLNHGLWITSSSSPPFSSSSSPLWDKAVSQHWVTFVDFSWVSVRSQHLIINGFVFTPQAEVATYSQHKHHLRALLLSVFTFSLQQNLKKRHNEKTTLKNLIKGLILIRRRGRRKTITRPPLVFPVFRLQQLLQKVVNVQFLSERFFKVNQENRFTGKHFHSRWRFVIFE